jgi:hypothetical protein
VEGNTVTAYSRLKGILKQQRMSIPELNRRIRASGMEVNVKSLYRLSREDHPLERLDMRVAGAICQACSVPLSDWIVFERESDPLRSLPADKQARLDRLMILNNSGQISPAERAELRTLVLEAEEITLANARILAAQRRRITPARSAAPTRAK